MLEKYFSLIIIGIILLVIYGIVFFVYLRDCKELGKENLAVSLKERFSMLTLFLAPAVICRILETIN